MTIFILEKQTCSKYLSNILMTFKFFTLIRQSFFYKISPTKRSTFFKSLYLIDFYFYKKIYYKKYIMKTQYNSYNLIILKYTIFSRRINQNLIFINIISE